MSVNSSNRAKAGRPSAGGNVFFEHEASDLWTIHRGQSPIIATAIHNGHAVRPDIAGLYALPADERLREEDPFTEYVTRDVPNRIAVHHSRFEVDLNRARDEAVYLAPEQCWGLEVWRSELPKAAVEASLRFHDDYYETLEATLRQIERRHGRFVLLDMHSYNHRRDGAEAAPTDPEAAPDINIGTFSMDRARWAPVVDALIAHLGAYEAGGRRFDVRENVAFQGRGEQTRFVHERFPETGCAIAIEFKKFFMDEWTGAPDPGMLRHLRAMIASTVPVLEETLKVRS